MSVFDSSSFPETSQSIAEGPFCVALILTVFSIHCCPNLIGISQMSFDYVFGYFLFA